MKKKWLAIGSILLFVGTCIVPAIAQNTEKPLPTSRGNWLYVGGSGPGNYTTIQDAVNDSSWGDTVFVYHGTYYENVVINKTVNLIGEDKESTILDGLGNRIAVVRINSYEVIDGVNISGFTLRHAKRGLFIFSDGSPDKMRNISIYDNIITLNDDGIVDNGCINSKICKNIIKDNTYKGIVIYECQNNYYTQNIIKNNPYGIESDGGGEQTIEKNYFTDNGVGILIWAGQNNYYTQNIIKNSSVGILNYGTDLQIIEKNTIEDNEKGIVFELYNRNKIMQNNFINNENDTSIDRLGFLLPFDFSDLLKFLLWFHVSKWDGNYWDEWKRTSPKPITGYFIVMYFPVLLQNYIHQPIPLGIYPYIKFDRHPAQEPYDIPGMK